MNRFAIVATIILTLLGCEQIALEEQPNERSIGTDTKNQEIICKFNPTAHPSFSGGLVGIKKYIKENSNWKDKRCFEGTVYVQFLVGEDGTIKDPLVLRGVYETCDIEAVRLVREMPRWSPGTWNGEPTCVKMIIPIRIDDLR